MARARRRGSRGDSFVEVAAEAVQTGASSAFRNGARVFHQKFGYGTVASSDGGKLEIEFEKAGTKKVMESFVEPV